MEGPRATAVERARLDELILTGSAREVLARIVPDDPLGLRARVGTCLRARALLCDAERVLLKAQAECAARAPAWRGAPEREDRKSGVEGKDGARGGRRGAANRRRAVSRS